MKFKKIFKIFINYKIIKVSFMIIFQLINLSLDLGSVVEKSGFWFRLNLFNLYLYIIIYIR